jgi:hypothetical protein
MYLEPITQNSWQLPGNHLIFAAASRTPSGNHFAETAAGFMKKKKTAYLQ